MGSVWRPGSAGLDDEGFSQWRTGNARITVFDIRGDDPVDSIVYPAYYTVDPLRWIDSMGCRRRVLIYCHHGGGASEVAGRLVARGYPADSVFFSGYSVITSSRFPATDTLPLHMLSRRAEPSRTMSPQELQALIHSDRAYRAVDVRTVEETEAGMIPGACVIPWPELFKSQLNRLGRGETIVLYCRSGNRAGQARQFMIDNGYTPGRPMLKLPPTISLKCLRPQGVGHGSATPCLSGNLGRRFWPPSMGLL